MEYASTKTVITKRRRSLLLHLHPRHSLVTPTFISLTPGLCFFFFSYIFFDSVHCFFWNLFTMFVCTPCVMESARAMRSGMASLARLRNANASAASCA